MTASDFRLRTYLIFIALSVAMLSSGVVQAADPTDDAMQNWRILLQDDRVFGDYMEASVDSVMAEQSRMFVDKSVADAPNSEAARVPLDSGKVQLVRLAERALWAGSNIEYCAFLSTATSDRRVGHATKATEYILRLRNMLRQWPSSTVDPASVPQWQDALLRLKLMEDDMLPEAAPRQQPAQLLARRALITEFDPSNLYLDTNDTSPNSLLMKRVGNAFSDARQLAQTAAAAKVQASLALGMIYGYPPLERDSLKEHPKLPGADLDVLYGENFKSVVAPLIMITSSGAAIEGIVWKYADARQRLGSTTLPFLTAAASTLPSDPIDLDILSKYQLEPLMDFGTSHLADAHADSSFLVNVMVATTRPTSQADFKRLTFDNLEEQHHRIHQLLEDLQRQQARSIASVAVSELLDEWNMLNQPAPLRPVDDQKYKDLLLVTSHRFETVFRDRNIVRNLDESIEKLDSEQLHEFALKSAESKIDNWFLEWINARVIRKPSEIGGGQ